jgi:hypothetical protein
MSPPKRVLVVAGKTVESPNLITELRRRYAHDAAAITLLVPAVPRGLAWAADMKAGFSEAIGRAEAGARRMRAAGLSLDGVVVGDPDPFAAAGDVLHDGGFDEVVVSTLPRSVSRWLRLGLPDRLRRAFPLPVTQVTSRRLRTRPRSRPGSVPVAAR